MKSSRQFPSFLLQTLETIWKSMRWLTDILQYARDRQVTGGVPLSVLYAPPPSPLEMNDNIGNTAHLPDEGMLIFLVDNIVWSDSVSFIKIVTHLV